MTGLHVSLAANVILLAVVAAFCVKHDVAAKIISRITLAGGGVIDPVLTDRWNFACDVFGNVPACDGVIIMLGDSLTENTPFSEYMSFRHRVMNRGISSDNTRGVLQRIGEASRWNASKVFILLGTNDIGNGIPLSESMSNYRAIIGRIRELSPGAGVYVQAVFPVDHKKLADNARCRRRTAAAIRAFNDRLRTLADETGCEFVDTWGIFADGDGEMDGACTWDGLHLNGAGMARWCGFLEQYM